MQKVTARHDALIRVAIEVHRGQVVKMTGDGFHAVFDAATDGLAAALTVQQAILAEKWPSAAGPIKVRMGLHTGESQERDGDYYGSEVNRAARVMGVAHGGQVLLSEATANLIRPTLLKDISLSDLGEHRLRGLAINERIFQVNHPALPLEFPPLKSLSIYKHNLPVQLSTFVGREKELADVKRLLQETRLLTLLGPGGTGKTRLMLESAEDVVADFMDGVWLVQLAPVTDASMIAERVAAALTVQEQPGREMLETLIAYLRSKKLLLLLDNVEHLVQASAELAEHLLTHCPELKILVTGREALFIDGEVALQIPSLSLPPSNGEIKLQEIRASESVQLFLTRAQEFRPDFELNQANAVTIAQIVRRLDGIPLALELASARLRMLSVEQIAERLDDRFRLLTGGRRTAVPRMQTLQAMIDWSWNLLDEKERLLLQRLSIFSGGWSLDAAQVVAGCEPLDEFGVFDFLEQLVNKSLVTVKYPAAGEARYGMLETIRQFGRERLIASGQGAAMRDRHADYFVAFAEEAAPHLAHSTMLPWTIRITLELDNLRAVLDWALEDRPQLALRIGGCLLYYLFDVTWLFPREAQAWLEPAIDRTRGLLDEEETEVRRTDFIKALIGLALANGIQGRSAVALSLAEESIQLTRITGETRLLAYAIGVKSMQIRFNMTPDAMRELEEAIAISQDNGYDIELAFSLMIYAMALDAQGKDDLAMTVFQEVVEVSRKISNPQSNALIYRVQGLVAKMQGKLDEAKRYALLAIENYEVLADRRAIVVNQSELAHLLRREGYIEEAEFYYRQSIVRWQEQGQPPAVAHQLECLAYIDIDRGHFDRAARLLGAARSERQKMNAFSEAPQEIQELALAMEQLVNALGKEQLDKVMADGSLITLDDAVQLALSEMPQN